MTTQVVDKITYRGQQYILIGISKHKLFNPNDYGFKLRSLSTACYRGWHAKYAIVDDTLFLEELVVTGVVDSFSVIHGIAPQVEKKRVSKDGLGQGKYTFTQYKLDYAGDLDIGKYDGKLPERLDPMIFSEFSERLRIKFVNGHSMGVMNIENIDSKKTFSKRSAALRDFLAENDR